jgi:hypothetical protein
MFCYSKKIFFFLIEIIERGLKATIFFATLTTSTALCASVATPTTTEADWTFLVYAQANNSLCPFAQKNFADMASIGSGKDLNLLVQWHDPTHKGIWRYKVERGRMELDMHLPVNIDGNAAKDLVDSMNWAVNKFPAKKYALILWNHGIGILDPVWGNQSMGFVRNEAILGNPRAHIEGITYIENSNFKDLPLKKITKKAMRKGGHRGILFNENTKTYMNNQTLSSALSAIKTTVLKNKNIDLLGMDACLMAMVEVCYQVRNYADYFVGSEEVELAFGWSYAPVVQRFVGKPTPVEAAKGIVQSYENLYRNKINFYTQSAIDLKLMDDLKNSINLVVQKLTACRAIDQRKVTATLKQARNQALQFSTSSYIDLFSFFQELQISVSANFSRTTTRNTQLIDASMELKNAIDIATKFIEQTVVANAAGKNMAQAKGLSVYFPVNGPVDQSYLYTDFATDCDWHSLLLMARGY